MILVDTSVWIEYFKHNPTFFSPLRTQIEHQNVVAAECIFGELLQGAHNPQESAIILQYWNNLPKRRETGLWLEAGVTSKDRKYFSKGVGLIDSFLITFAGKHRLRIWTLDKKLLSVLKTNEIFEYQETER